MHRAIRPSTVPAVRPPLACSGTTSARLPPKDRARAGSAPRSCLAECRGVPRPPGKKETHPDRGAGGGTHFAGSQWPPDLRLCAPSPSICGQPAGPLRRTELAARGLRGVAGAASALLAADSRSSASLASRSARRRAVFAACAVRSSAEMPMLTVAFGLRDWAIVYLRPTRVAPRSRLAASRVIGAGAGADADTPLPRATLGCFGFFGSRFDRFCPFAIAGFLCRSGRLKISGTVPVVADLPLMVSRQLPRHSAPLKWAFSIDLQYGSVVS